MAIDNKIFFYYLSFRLRNSFYPLPLLQVFHLMFHHKPTEIVEYFLLLCTRRPVQLIERIAILVIGNPFFRQDAALPESFHVIVESCAPVAIIDKHAQVEFQFQI